MSAKRLASDYLPPANAERVVFRARRPNEPFGFYTVEHCRVIASPANHGQFYGMRWADVRDQLLGLGYTIEEMSRSRKAGWSAGRKK